MIQNLPHSTQREYSLKQESWNWKVEGKGEGRRKGRSEASPGQGYTWISCHRGMLVAIRPCQMNYEEKNMETEKPQEQTSPTSQLCLSQLL